jgi:hypothetical protein
MPVRRINQEIPDELHRELRVEAAQRGTTLKDLVVQLLSEAMARRDETRTKTKAQRRQ